MRLARPLLYSTVPLLLTVLGSAQTKVWTVDDDGPADFSDIQSAVDASSDGDSILVGAGDYSGFTVAARSINIVGVPDSTTLHSGIRVESLTANQVVVLSDLFVHLPLIGNSYPLSALWCVGSIRAQSCRFRALSSNVTCYDGYPSIAGYTPGAYIFYCEDVCLTDCFFKGADGDGDYAGCAHASDYYCYPGEAGIWADESTVTLYDCETRGGRGGDTDDYDEYVSGGQGGPGVRLTDSFLFTSNSHFQGGDGGDLVIPANYIGPGRGGPGFNFGNSASELQLLDPTIIPGSGGCDTYYGGWCAPDGSNYQAAGSAVIVQIPGIRREMEISSPRQLRDTSVLATFRGEAGDQVYLPVDWGTDFTFDATVKGTWVLPQPATLPPLPIAVIPASGEIQVEVPFATPNGGNLAEVEFRQMYVVSATGEPILGSPAGTLQIDCTGPTNYCTGAPNSVGPGAVISLSGSTSVSAGDAVLHASDLPPSQFGLFYYGPNQIQLPWGDGFRCVGGGVYRLGAVSSDGSGNAIDPLDYTSPPMHAGSGKVIAGGSWNFQYWYRDPSGPVGSGFNASDALAITFCP